MELKDLVAGVSPEHILAQRDRLFSIIETDFANSPERIAGLKTLYTEMEDRLLFSPASGKIHYHNAYEGGYLDHILHVYDTALKLIPVYRAIGGTIDFNKSELAFVTLHHDLGKLGDEDGPYYEKEHSDFWQKKGVRFTYAKDAQLITVHDRTIYLLNKYGIKMTKNELIALRMADGLFEDANERYFKGSDVFPHKSSLCYIMHWADWMAAISEKDQVRKQYQNA